MNYDLKIIKDNYGEKMMHLCRELFPTLLEKEGLLSSLILNKFHSSRLLYEDIVENHCEYSFKNYIYNLVDIERMEKKATNKTPQELLEEVGYDLYECKTEEDIQKFKKYYKSSEELCTFNGGRLERCYVFFAVKKDVDNIIRKDFKNPRRDDLYGTSVMSIQFTKGNINTLSIKNRYNHTVNNSDATLSNNLENIIPGLTESFERVYSLNINQTEMNNFELPNYVRANDGKYYKYNYELNNVYYCSDNIIIDNFEVKRFPKERYIVLDYFILDLKEKKMKNYQTNMHDSFPLGFDNIEKINIIKENNNKIIDILTNTKNKIIIKLDKRNKIISYKNNKLDVLENNFLRYNDSLEELDIPNVQCIKNNCLIYNEDCLKYLNLPKVKRIGDFFLNQNKKLAFINALVLESVGRYCLSKNEELKTIDFPNLKGVGCYFLEVNKKIEDINAPKLKHVESGFMQYNENLKKVDFPELESVESDFLEKNEQIEVAKFPKLKIIGSNFMRNNKNLKRLELPLAQKIGNYFLLKNENLEFFSASNLEEIGNSFLRRNSCLKSIKLPKTRRVGECFICDNKNIEEVEIPLLEEIGWHFLFDCENVSGFNFSKLNEESKNSFKEEQYYRKINMSEDGLFYSKIVEVEKVNFITKIINKLFKKSENSIGGNHIK